MKRIVAILALVAVIGAGSAGCTTLKAIWGVTTAPSETVTVIMVDADKALLTAHNLYKAAGFTLSALANAGVLHGDLAATAKTYYDQAGDYLIKADNAHDLGSAVLTKQYADAATQLIALATTTH